MNTKRLRPLALACLALALTACSGSDPQTPTACLPTATPASAPATSLLDVLTQARAAHGLRAIVFNATQNGQPVLTTALGESKPGVPASTAMHFRVGMAAEQFVTTVMMRLVDEGKLSLDEPLSKWFPAYPNADRATVRMLALSSTGFGDYVYGPGDPARGIASFPDLLYSDVRRNFTANELITRSQAPYQVPQYNNPGGNWEYSHTNFVMLGALLEQVSGRSYSSLLQDHVLQPLALRNTEYTTTAQPPAPLLNAFTSERGTYEESTDWSPSWTSFSGSVNSNVCDLATWTRAFGTGALVKPESARQFTAPTTVGLGRNTTTLYFGLGVIVSNGWLVADGNFFGWHTATAYHPGTGHALVLSWTEGPNTADPMRISKDILQTMSRLLTPQTPISFPG